MMVPVTKGQDYLQQRQTRCPYDRRAHPLHDARQHHYPIFGCLHEHDLTAKEGKQADDQR